MIPVIPYANDLEVIMFLTFLKRKQTMIAPFVSLPLFGLQFIFPNIFLYFLYKDISGTPCELENP